MNFDINVTAGLVAGLAAMVPGSIIYLPGVLGKRWMKEIGLTEKDMKGNNPGKAMTMMLLTALISGLIASLFVSSLGASNIIEALDVCLLLVWFPISVNLSQVFFERRSWGLCGISALNHFLTFAVIGVVLGLFL